jgi:hypothetical protein
MEDAQDFHEISPYPICDHVGDENKLARIADPPWSSPVRKLRQAHGRFDNRSDDARCDPWSCLVVEIGPDRREVTQCRAGPLERDHRCRGRGIGFSLAEPQLSIHACTALCGTTFPA